MTRYSLSTSAILFTFTLGVLACEPAEDTVEPTTSMDGTATSVPVSAAASQNFEQGSQLLDDQAETVTEANPTGENTDVDETVAGEEETLTEETGEAEKFTVDFQVEYDGTVQGNLLVSLFEVWPPTGPPSHFDMIENVSFPATAALLEIPAGDWTAVAVLDSAPINPASQGPEDRVGLTTVTVPSSGAVTIIIEDVPPEGTVPAEEVTEEVTEEQETIETLSTLRFDRIDVDNKADGPAFATFEDINEDGKEDIIVASFGTVTGFTLPYGEVTIYTQGDTIEDWTASKIVTEADEIVWPNDISFEDVDGDGDLDAMVPFGFLVCGAIPLTGPCGGLAWFEQDGGNWVRHDVIPSGDALFYHKALLTDLNGDGLKDLITVGEEKLAGLGGVTQRAEAYWFAGTDSDDRFDTEAQFIGNGLGSLPELHDIDGDGDMDIVSAEFFADLGASFTWMEQVTAPGAGQPAGEWKRHVIDQTSGPSIQVMLIEDFFGDGEIIALGANHTNPNAETPDPEASAFNAYRIPADPKDTWTKTVITEVFDSVPGSGSSPQAAPGVFGVGDIDADEDIDVVISGDGDSRTFLLEQLPNEEFVVHVLDQGMGQAGGMVISDIDNDGVSEILTTSYDAGGVYIYIQSENGNYPVGVAEAPQAWLDENTPELGDDLGTEDVTDEQDNAAIAPLSNGPYSVSKISTVAGSTGVELDVYMPEGVDSPKVIGFHHGFMLSKAFYSSVAERLASHGFAVMAPQTHEPGGLPFGKPTVTEELPVVLSVYDWILDGSAAAVLGAMDTTEIGVLGHSRGGKIAWLVGQNRPESIKAVIAVDPVDSAGAVTAGDTMALDQPLPSSISSLVMGMDLAGVAGGLFNPACAPEDSNYTDFYGNATGDAWSILFEDGGHLDMLDDNPPNCGAVCTQCTAGDKPATNRDLIAGLSLAFFNVIIEGKTEELTFIEDTTQHPVATSIQSK